MEVILNNYSENSLFSVYVYIFGKTQVIAGTVTIEIVELNSLILPRWRRFSSSRTVRMILKKGDKTFESNLHSWERERGGAVEPTDTTELRHFGSRFDT